MSAEDLVVEEVRRALRALVAPEPDEPLQGHPENVAAWQRWNDERLWALSYVQSLERSA